MGGNIFGNTDKIRKEDIKPTLSHFFLEMKSIFPKADIHFKDIRLLGSAGKKEYSGDIDLAMDEKAFDKIEDWELDPKHVQDLFQGFKKRAKTSTDSQLMKRAVIVAIAEKIEESPSVLFADLKGSSAGALFLKFPQYDEKGNKLETNVQIDINVGKVDWLSFAYHSATYKGSVKGLHRTQLMLSLFSNRGFTFSHNYGVKDKDTQEIVAENPQEAIDLLNQLYDFRITQDILNDYFKLMDFIKKHLSQEELHAIFDRYLKILDSTRADIPEDLQQYWIDNQQRLGLKGKFLPNNSDLLNYKIQ